MTDNQTPDTERWRSADELPPDVFDILLKADSAINPISIVATVDPDGTPRTAPFGSLRAVTPKLLRFASSTRHDTYANLVRDNRISIALLSPPNTSVSITGCTRIVREPMNYLDNYAIFEVNIIKVKNDMLRGKILSGVQFDPPKLFKKGYLEMIKEIEEM